MLALKGASLLAICKSPHNTRTSSNYVGFSRSKIYSRAAEYLEPQVKILLADKEW